jgi:hypothetical protein
LSIARAEQNSSLPILGVVSTKPGLTLGYDDTSLQAGETAYPVALAGRVPVQLSTENGPIKKGDQLMLSSLPGIAMKATGTGATIGIALEDFTQSRMYSDTYLNQFGDDMVDPVYEPVVSNTDARINDGCYYSGGNAAGEDPCEPLVATTSANQIAEVNTRLAEDSVAEQIRDLKRVRAQSRNLASGQSVQVGQVVMFVQSGYRWVDESRLASMNSLFSTSTLSEVGENEQETLFDRLVTLANSLVDGVFSIFELRADRVEVANELCVDGVCINAGDLRALLESTNADGQIVEVTETSTENPDADSGDTDTETTTNPDPTASSTEEIEDTASTTATSTEQGTVDGGATSSTTASSTATTTEEPVTEDEENSSTTPAVTDPEPEESVSTTTTPANNQPPQAPQETDDAANDEAAPVTEEVTESEDDADPPAPAQVTEPEESASEGEAKDEESADSSETSE